MEGLLQRCQQKGLLPEDIHTVDKVKLQLRELASEREIPGRSSMNKAELIDALRTD